MNLGAKTNYNERFRFIGVERYQRGPVNQGLHPILLQKSAKGWGTRWHNELIINPEKHQSGKNGCN